jgi:hypothetical protein
MVEDKKTLVPAGRGIPSWVVAREGVPDLFEYAEQYHGFPCIACKHVSGPQEHCWGCTHYAV